MQIVGKFAAGCDLQLLQLAVVDPHGFLGAKLAVGNAAIDDDHRRLVQMVNDLYAAMQRGNGSDVIGKVVHNLALYTKQHFAREEAEMQRIRYARQLQHKQEHEKLLKEVGDLQNAYAAGKPVMTLAVAKFLSDWLTNHIKGSDVQLAAAIAAHRGKVGATV